MKNLSIYEKPIKAESLMNEIQYELNLISEENLTEEGAAKLIVLLENLAILQEKVMAVSADAINKLKTGLDHMASSK